MNDMHHLCIYDEYCTLDGVLFPYGGKLVEETLTATISTLLDEIISKIGTGEVFVCGIDPVRRMVGRKLEDRLGRKVTYE